MSGIRLSPGVATLGCSNGDAFVLAVIFAGHKFVETVSHISPVAREFR
jgi:hypothetical protein